MSANEFPGKGLPHLVEADNWEDFDSHVAEIAEKDLEELTALSQPDDEHSDAVVEI
jgi:hypothetical protein